MRYLPGIYLDRSIDSYFFVMGLLKTALFFLEDYMDVALPDKKHCKTRYISDQLWECLVESSLVCPYNINLGAEYFCLHRNCKDYEDAGKKLVITAYADKGDYHEC